MKSEMIAICGVLPGFSHQVFFQQEEGVIPGKTLGEPDQVMSVLPFSKNLKRNLAKSLPLRKVLLFFSIPQKKGLSYLRMSGRYTGKSTVTSTVAVACFASASVTVR